MDYFCHRRTHIDKTSGPHESAYHAIQFWLLAIALLAGVFLVPSPLSFAIMCAAVLMHTFLGYKDVAYTFGRRSILPLEQSVHGYLEVVPVVLIVAYGIANAEAVARPGMPLKLHDAALSAEQWWLLGSYLLVAGAFVTEEFVRIRIAKWVWPPLNRTR